jgi:hypothetical protein
MLNKKLAFDILESRSLPLSLLKFSLELHSVLGQNHNPQKP